MGQHSTIDWVAMVLVIIGALNWGLVGAANLNIVDAIFGMGIITKVIYILVGLSGLWMIVKIAQKKK